MEDELDTVLKTIKSRKSAILNEIPPEEKKIWRHTSNSTSRGACGAVVDMLDSNIVLNASELKSRYAFAFWLISLGKTKL